MMRLPAFTYRAPRSLDEAAAWLAEAPGDTMVMQGRVTKVDTSASAPTVTVDFAGINRRGTHVSGNATLALAG